ncbi:hypothetical protein [Spirochaeta lutea]|uniref:Uncharacterized protein n=1 Tax=Spirochaeta lutea TaxID=1480694 RepID=A0A098R0V0_9SPIO|nr:hypothetical protein [Spirochaeta lutea]KGE73371.1 hypothetical protein DC28_04460 [Spirochaeta lutea]
MKNTGSFSDRIGSPSTTKTTVRPPSQENHLTSKTLKPRHQQKPQELPEPAEQEERVRVYRFGY